MNTLVLGLLCALSLVGDIELYTGEVYKAMAAGNLQSVSAAIAINGRVRHLIVRGYANRWAGVRAKAETIYPFGAVTQTFTAASVLKLASEKKISLDEPLERRLGGVRIKGQEPGAPISARHVLAHASGLVDTREPVQMHRGLLPAVPAALLLSNVLFAAKRPAAEVRYSSIGYAALGLLISSVTGKAVPEYFRETWLQPLSLQSTAFYSGGIVQERLAIGYTRPAEGAPAPMQMFYHSPSSPMLGADGLCGTAADLAQWVLVNLSSTPAEDARQVQYPSLKGKKSVPQSLFASDEAGWGLGWIVLPCGADRCIAQIGGSPGYTAIAVGNVTRGVAVAILTNSDSAHAVLVELAMKLQRLARSESASGAAD